jgi:hypothetical protein
MKTLKIIGVVVLAFVLILAIVIAIQPSDAHIEKTIVINAPASAVFPEVSNYRNFNVWSPWAKMDPQTKHTFEGTEATVGSKMSWDGPETGRGSQWIEQIEENKRVRNGMTFEGYDVKFYNEFILEDEGQQTRVTWTFDGHNSDTKEKAMWVIMGSMLSSQYDQGLKDLKKLVESKTGR